ncbi:thiolase family protein [Mycolicibacter sinensis]|uniref:Sterol carrier protein n=1 Tax=Mycolicibacter sinensis (strain JDM601) TaxID=875328 RepID=A0A1A3TU88_MYCSD|nr:thiolase family protein [Mycolicibacter sinensis]OBK86199.1 sterol carrier protein [Mycolicibacter sinensis]
MAVIGAAIAGLGITDVGKVYGRSATDFAADAVRRATADAGLLLHDVDGLLVSSGLKKDVSVALQRVLGLRDLRLLSEMNAFGASAGAMVSYAAAMVSSGAATTVACVFADAPLKPKESAGAAYSGRAHKTLTGFASYRMASGIANANTKYALAARRHMQTYGTTTEQFGAIAVAQRSWAAMNPLAQLREPITLEDHRKSRWIADPLRLLDCCLVSNGGAAVIITTVERARDLAQPTVPVLGYGQGHPGQAQERGADFGLRTGATISGPIALRMAGASVSDVDLLELYDCYTYTVLITLEDYGFCAKGDGGRFVEDGRTGPGGELPVNTGGGQLSSYYLWGMTPLAEAVIQARGQAGERQVVERDVIMVSGNGGVLDHHSTLVLGGTQ